ncbi:MAG: SHOCT domain-containing protein [Euryarchaeota archaeon]|nr:SHOCT domain-containing protein [Euryarchaeota archaeon]
MKRYLGYITFAVLGFLLLLTVLYETGHPWGLCQAWGGMMEMHRRYAFGYGFSIFGIAFWVLVLAFLYLLLTGREEREESAIDILNRRLARGEITREEYLEMKREILGEK